MICGIGIDIARNYRIKSAVMKWQSRFLDRVYTKKEIDYCMGKGEPHNCLAARFAAKEAAIKALGFFYNKSKIPFSFKDIEILADNMGRPFLEFNGKLGESVKTLPIKTTHVSLSHEQEYSVAVVILEN